MENSRSELAGDKVELSISRPHPTTSSASACLGLIPRWLPESQAVWPSGGKQAPAQCSQQPFSKLLAGAAQVTTHSSHHGPGKEWHFLAYPRSHVLQNQGGETVPLEIHESLHGDFQ